LVVKAITTFDRNRYSYYDRGYTIVYILTDAYGNTVLYKATTNRARYGNENELERGDHVTMTATVKEHSVYKGVNQTIVQRPKWTLTLRPAGQIDDQVETIDDNDSIF